MTIYQVMQRKYGTDGSTIRDVIRFITSDNDEAIAFAEGLSKEQQPCSPKGHAIARWGSRDNGLIAVLELEMEKLISVLAGPEVHFVY